MPKSAAAFATTYSRRKKVLSLSKVSVGAEKRMAGGSIDSAGILAALCGQFELCDHPDFRRDWEVLDRYSPDGMGDVRTDVEGRRPRK